MSTENHCFTIKEKLEMVATCMTIFVSLTIIISFFYAHRAGFFAMIHKITEHHHATIIENNQPEDIKTQK